MNKGMLTELKSLEHELQVVMNGFRSRETLKRRGENRSKSAPARKSSAVSVQDPSRLINTIKAQGVNLDMVV